MSTAVEITSCLVCERPLGQETRDMDWRTCHEHRKCTICQHPLNRGEIHNAHQSAIDDSLTIKDKTFQQLIEPYLAHSRCQLSTRKNAEQDPDVLVKQSYLDWLNRMRLENPYAAILEPNAELSKDSNEKQAGLMVGKYMTDPDVTFEEKYLFLARLESAVSHASVAFRLADKKEIKKNLDKREAAKFEQAKKEALTSGRPQGKPVEDEKEVLIGQFMKQNDIKDRKVAINLWKERNKAIQGMIKAGMAEGPATQFVDSQLKAQGRIK